MSQFRIKGIDYTDDSLQHGLGKGSGRGRPVGSKNGQVMPGAAYMKDYKIVGQKAEGADGSPLSTYSRNNPNQNRRDRGQSGGGTRRLLSESSRSSRPAQRRSSPIANALKNRNVGVVSAPAANVARGRNAVNQLMGENANKPLTYTTDTGNNAPIKTGNLTPIDRSKYVERPANFANTTNQSANVANTSSKPVSNSANEARVANVERRIDQNATNVAKQETPEQKSFWDNIGGWFAQAGKDIADTAVGAWNTASGAFNDASKWVGDRLNDAGEWAQTAYNDVSNWVGARSKEFGDWVGNAANDVGRFVGDTANNVGRAVNEFWNGRDVNPGDYDLVGRAPKPYHEQGVGEQLGNFFNNAGQWVGNAANDAGRWIGNAANDVGRFVGNTANDVGRWVGDTANNIGRAANEFWNGRDVEVNDNGRMRQGHEPGFAERAGNAANDVGQFVTNIPNAVQNAANAAGQWVSNAANDVGRAANKFWNGRDVEVDDNGRWRQGHEPGVGEQIGNFINGAGQWVGNAVNDVGRAADEFWNGRVVNPGDYDLTGRAPKPYREGGVVNDVGNFVNNAGQWIGNTANNVGRAVDYWWNGTPYNEFADPSAVGFVPGDPNANPRVGGAWRDISSALGQAGNAANDARRWAENAINNGVQAVDTFVNGPRPGSPESAPYYDLTSQQWIDPMTQSFGDRVGQWANNNIVTPVSNATNAAGQWANDNIVNPVAAAANAAGQWANNNVIVPVSNAANAAGQWINEGIVTPVANAANNAGQAVGNFVNNTVNSVNQAISNEQERRATAQRAEQERRDRAQRVETASPIAEEAVNSGVNSGMVNQLTNLYVGGQITLDEYEDRINNVMMAYGRQ